MNNKNVIDAYCKIRKMDNTIPDDVLDFMKEAALEKLSLIGQLNMPARVSIVGDTFNFFPNHHFVKHCVFANKGKEGEKEVHGAMLQANFVNAMARLADLNGLSNNDVQHLITPMLRLLNTKDSDWTK